MTANFISGAIAVVTAATALAGAVHESVPVLGLAVVLGTVAVWVKFSVQRNGDGLTLAKLNNCGGPRD